MPRHAQIEAWLAREPAWRQFVALLRREPMPAYLVGGSVRDALLGRSGCDLDVVVEGDALSLGRRLADRLGGAYMPLDSERHVARIILKTGDAVLHVDLAGLRAPDILGDLWDRDLTINAMALPLHGSDALLDPTGGQADLQARLVRMVTPASFGNDPARVLRALRLSEALGFALTPDTAAALERYAPALARVSPERLRDELCQILALPDAVTPLVGALECGALAVMLPELGDAPAMRRVLAVLAVVESPNPREEFSFWPPAAHWNEELTFGHSRWLMVKWAALLAGVGTSAEVTAIAQRLRLSVREARYLADAVGSCAQVLGWRDAAALDPLTIYRHYRRAGDAGVAGSLLAWAWHKSAGVESPVLAQHVQALWCAWFGQYEALVDPPTLLTGDQLMDALGLAPGPVVGRLLETVREAQVQGHVRTHEQALDWARRLHTAGSGLAP